MIVHVPTLLRWIREVFGSESGGYGFETSWFGQQFEFRFRFGRYEWSGLEFRQAQSCRAGGGSGGRRNGR